MGGTSHFCGRPLPLWGLLRLLAKQRGSGAPGFGCVGKTANAQSSVFFGLKWGARGSGNPDLPRLESVISVAKIVSDCSFHILFAQSGVEVGATAEKGERTANGIAWRRAITKSQPTEECKQKPRESGDSCGFFKRRSKLGQGVAGSQRLSLGCLVRTGGCKTGSQSPAGGGEHRFSSAFTCLRSIRQPWSS